MQGSMPTSGEAYTDRPPAKTLYETTCAETCTVVCKVRRHVQRQALWYARSDDMRGDRHCGMQGRIQGGVLTPM